MTEITTLKIFLSIAAGFFSYFLGGYDLTLKTMLCLTVIDYITGIGSAIYKKKFKASICIKGIFKKVYMYITVMIAVIIQRFTGDIIPLREIVIIFYIVNEGMSALENIGKVIKYPERLREVFSQLNDKNV